MVEFRDIHKLLATTDKVCQTQAVSGKWDITITLAAVQKLCSKASEVFHSLNLMNKWNISHDHWDDASGLVCFDCSTPYHTSDKCPLSHNETKITKAKEVHTESIAEGRGSIGCGCGRRHSNGVVAMGVTVPILGASGVLMMVPLLPVLIHLWVMDLRRKMDCG